MSVSLDIYPLIILFDFLFHLIFISHLSITSYFCIFVVIYIIHYFDSSLIVGTHTFIANIQYSQSNELLYLQRRFSFEVNKPIDIKTKYVSPEYLDFTILESRIHNLTHHQLFFDELSLRSLNKYSVTPMKLYFDPSVGSSLSEIQTKNTYSYLFKISSPQNSFISSKDIGKLDICWRNSLIQRGRLQTGNLDKPIKSSQDLRVLVAKVPNYLYCDSPFDIHLIITNISYNSLALQLSFDDLPGGINWCGKSNILLPELLQQVSIPITLKAICFSPGNMVIGGLTFIDLKMNRNHHFNYSPIHNISYYIQSDMYASMQNNLIM